MVATVEAPRGGVFIFRFHKKMAAVQDQRVGRPIASNQKKISKIRTTTEDRTARKVTCEDRDGNLITSSKANG